MFLTKLIVDRKSNKELRLEDPYAVHRFIYSLFPGNKRDFLYYESTAKEYSRVFLILSRMQPIVPEYGELQIKRVPEDFLNGNVYGFQVKLNPSRRSGETRKIVPIKNREEILAWFLEKQENFGFSVEEETLEVFDIGVQSMVVGDRGTLTHSQATVKGVLHVTDREAFYQSFENGIGRGKAFGFGLLQLVKLN